MDLLIELNIIKSTSSTFVIISANDTTGRSCETQLITTFHDIASAYNKKGSQIDIVVLDFSKAFDTVPHDGLLSKLKHYGIDDKIWTWISNFLKQRKQRVVVDGIQSDNLTWSLKTQGFHKVQF